MIEAWRIVKAKHVAGAFTGEGAALTGGRWNSRRVLVVYSSGTKSLAALETLVHLNPSSFFAYQVFRIQFDETLTERISVDALPPDWQSEPPPPSTKAIGDSWARAGRSVVLALPSVIIPNELNYLLNPAHAGFKKIKIGQPEDFAFDARLLA